VGADSPSLPEGAARARDKARREPIYLDHHATTPVDERVLEAMAPYWSRDFGNAASRTHRYGWRAEAAVELARERLAEAIGAAEPREIVFTSGATESDNLAIQGVLRPALRERDQVVTVATEHAAVLDTVRALEPDGVRARVLPVDGDGRVDPAAVASGLDERTALVSVAAANGEVGTLQPLAEIARVCLAHDVLLHSDGAQALGKIPLDVDEAGVDLLSLSAHKVYGPKGIGALYVRRRRRSGSGRVRIEPLVHGGGHEHGLRSGTLPVPLIVGFAAAVELALADREAEATRQAALRDRLFAALANALPGVHWNGPPAAARLPGNLNVSFDGVAADALLSQLEDVAISTGSACSSARPEPSHVLAALGLPKERIQGAVRVGLGRGTTVAEIDQAAARITEEVLRLRSGEAPPLLRR
jgi:cysteine desulfurase